MKKGTLASVIVFALCVGCGTTTSDNNDSGGIDPGFGSQDASGDVSLVQGSCDGGYGILTCKLDITNSSDGTSDYYIEAEIDDASGANIGTANAFVQHVAGGQSAHTELTGTLYGEMGHRENHSSSADSLVTRA
jgi:hypothetical protein